MVKSEAHMGGLASRASTACDGRLAETFTHAHLRASRRYGPKKNSHSGSRNQYEGDTRNHGWRGPHVHVLFLGPSLGTTSPVATLYMEMSRS